MKSLLLIGLLLGCILSTPAMAQESIIKVVGNSRMEIAPDQVTTSIFLEAFASGYEETVIALNEQTKEISQVLQSQGFSKKEIKTLGFTAQPNYEYRDGKRRQNGYRASQRIELIFAFDQTQLKALVIAISKGESTPNFNISFFLSEEKKASVKEALITKAMADAKMTAEILAKSQDKELNGFSEISYGVQESVQPQRYQMDAMMMKSEAAPDFAGFEAKDIAMTEQVHVIWQVK